MRKYTCEICLGTYDTDKPADTHQELITGDEMTDGEIQSCDNCYHKYVAFAVKAVVEGIIRGFYIDITDRNVIIHTTLWDGGHMVFGKPREKHTCNDNN